MRVAAANTPAPLDSPHLLHYVPVLFQLGIEGRIAIVTDGGWNAVDATSAERRAARARTAKSCGPGRKRKNRISFKKKGPSGLLGSGNRPHGPVVTPLHGLRYSVRSRMAEGRCRCPA